MGGVQVPDELRDRAARLASSGRRGILGITGPPAAGKSTLAAALVAELDPAAVLVPMDGFHLAQSELDRLGRHERKGAPDTFDALGFIALVRRLRDQADAVVYAPAFHREIEEPVAGAIPVPASVPLVVTEGNYLLLKEDPWSQVRPLLDEVWYLDGDEARRRTRLIARHVAFGRRPDEAAAHALGSDEHNAVLIAATRPDADVVVTLELSSP